MLYITCFPPLALPSSGFGVARISFIGPLSLAFALPQLIKVYDYPRILSI